MRRPTRFDAVTWFSLGWVAGIGFAWLTLTFR
jgi:hypothetical protein